LNVFAVGWILSWGAQGDRDRDSDRKEKQRDKWPLCIHIITTAVVV